MSEYEINGMVLPSTLTKAINDGSWTEAGKHWNAFFPRDVARRPQLYNLQLMQRQNLAWQHESQAIFIGVADGNVVPGVLNPLRSLLIGELDGDDPIALDYGNEKQSPSVVFLNAQGYWVEIAQSFDEFWSHLMGYEAERFI